MIIAFILLIDKIGNFHPWFFIFTQNIYIVDNTYLYIKFSFYIDIFCYYDHWARNLCFLNKIIFHLL